MTPQSLFVSKMTVLQSNLVETQLNISTSSVTACALWSGNRPHLLHIHLCWLIYSNITIYYVCYYDTGVKELT